MVNRIYWFILIKTCVAQKLTDHSVFHNKMLFRFIATQKKINNKQKHNTIYLVKYSAIKLFVFNKKLLIMLRFV